MTKLLRLLAEGLEVSARITNHHEPNSRGSNLESDDVEDFGDSLVIAARDSCRYVAGLGMLLPFGSVYASGNYTDLGGERIVPHRKRG